MTVYPAKKSRLAMKFILRYALAVVAIATALGMAHLFLRLGLPQPFASFALCAVAITFWYVGIGPGLLAALLAAIIRNDFFGPEVGLASRISYDLIFVLFAWLMIQAARARHKLEDRVSARTADLVKANDELRESQAYLAEAQRLAQMGTWVWGVDDRRALYISEEWHRIYGFDPHHGLLDWEQRLKLIHPDDRAQWQATIERAIQQKADYEIEFRILLSDGTVRCIHAVGHPVFDASKTLVKFIGISMDITEAKRAEEQKEKLRRLEADLAHMNRISVMGELAASLAHEIKQPIAAAAVNARTGLRWLQREPPDIEEACETLSRIANDVQRASEIIERNRSLYGRDEPRHESMDVNRLIHEISVLLNEKARQHSIPIRTELHTDLPDVVADRVQVQQVLMNLMLNALEAMRDVGGEVTVRTHRGEDGRILISVSDLGPGLTLEHGEHIFDAFFTTKANGTGMGLSISRRIIESHGGRLWATANDGRGATFQFTLPCEAATSTSSSSA
jgi:PAS domain S-box-containing protein